jgi:hypothetical protein
MENRRPKIRAGMMYVENLNQYFTTFYDTVCGWGLRVLQVSMCGAAYMSVNIEGYRNESFESLEAAVMETQRGRWFLEEYAKRQRSAESLAIIDILRKLETSIASSSPKDMAPANPINPEQLKFFKKDEEMFVAPVAAPALKMVPPSPVTEAQPPAQHKGAKLKIQRVSADQASAERPEAEVAAEAPVSPEKAETPPVAEVAIQPEPAKVSAEPAPEPRPRVVIIRRPASEAVEIPMMDEHKPEVAA